VATAHDAGVVHRSIGQNSFLLSSVGRDEREATGPYAVVAARLRIVSSDWGFSAAVEAAATEEEPGARSRTFGVPTVGSYKDRVPADDRVGTAAVEFAKAKDLHALGLV